LPADGLCCSFISPEKAGLLDSITHILSGALWTEPVRPPLGAEGHYARWRERAAIVAAALLPDADGVLGWIDPALYGKYHRVVTHSVGGLIALAFLSALIAKHWPRKWLLPFLRKNADSSEIAPSFLRLSIIASITTLLHFLGDWIGA
jgi:heme A synthase